MGGFGRMRVGPVGARQMTGEEASFAASGVQVSTRALPGRLLVEAIAPKT